MIKENVLFNTFVHAFVW